jgi:hypothetical protein
MAIETKSHSNLSQNSSSFVLANGGAYTATVVGLTTGGDPIELHMLDSHGQPISLAQSMKFTPRENGGSKMFTVPAGTLMRWTVPQVPGVAVHSATTNIVSSN